MAEIKITIFRDPNKGTQTEVEGAVGQNCKAMTEAIEKALGTVVNEELKPEFYETPLEQEQQLGNQG